MRFYMAVFFLAAIYSCSPGLSARILGLFPCPSFSHQVVYRAVMEELAKRGHEIVVLTTDPVHYKDKQFENITEIDVHDISYDLSSKTFVSANAKKEYSNPVHILFAYKNMSVKLIDLQLSVPEMKAILKNEEENFDLVFVEGYIPINHVAGARFKAPVIEINSASAMIADFEAIGNPIHPILYTDIFVLHVGQLNFWQRLDRIYGYLLQVYYNWIYSDQFNEIARKHYGADVPTVEEAQRQMSMLFINAHPILNGIRPVVPTVVYIGGSHLKPKKIFSEDLKRFLDESKQGVIYMSFGSNVKSKDLPMSKINVFNEVFCELPYNVLWKFENDTLPGKPHNVFISKWLPQNDVLGHPHIKAFITQGGLQSLEEAIHNHVPLIGIPFMGDQDFNVKKIIHFGIGTSLNIDNLNKITLKKAILEIVENNKYRSSIKRLSQLLEDSSESGLERAVWWAEYVIRHGGAEHLRAPSVPVYQYFMLDIIAFVVFAILPLGLAARILGLFPIPSISHQVVYRSVVEALAKRGHEIVVLTPDPVHYKDKQFENITEIDVHDISYDLMLNTIVAANMKEELGHPRNAMPLLKKMSIQMVDLQMSVPKMKAILENKKEHFDLILIEGFVPINYVAAARFKAPVIGINSASAMITDFEAVGNPTHPVLYADLFSFDDGQLDFWQRLDHVYGYILHKYYDWAYSDQFNEIARKYYGSDMPTVEEAQRQMSMLFLNAHPILTGIRPVVPAVISISGSHVKPKKILPEDLKKFLDESKQGVIYMSLGSNVKSKDLPMSKINTFVEVFRELPYNVLWKFENDTLPGQPPNVLISKWLPQNDVLGHANIKAFITQGGLQSFEEALHNKVPLIGIPFMGDQDFNVKKMIRFGIGTGLDITTLDKTSLKETIIEIAENKRYRTSIIRLSNLLEDNPEGALERAVWWAEYVIRHGGAEHLRAPSIPLYQYFMLDILAFVVFTIFATVIMSCSIIGYFVRRMFGTTKLKRL